MAKQFGWIGVTRRLIVLDIARAVVSTWAAAWSTRNVEVDARLMGDDEVPNDDLPWLVHDGSVALALEGEPELLAATLLGLPATDNPLALHVANEALAALMVAMGRGLPPATSSPGRLTSALRDTRFGAVGIHITAGPIVLHVRMARCLIDVLAPPPGSGRPSLNERRSLVDELTHSVAVELPLGSVRLGDVGELRVGDVLATRVPLSALAYLRIDEQPLPLPGIGARPGRQDARRAIAIESLTPSELHS